MLLSTKTSTDERFAIIHYQSRAEVGHAFQGEHLVMRFGGSFATALDGEVFFAGYCGPKSSYTWESDKEILIVCPSAEDEGEMNAPTT
jgi:hypothetical protein